MLLLRIARIAMDSEENLSEVNVSLSTNLLQLTWFEQITHMSEHDAFSVLRHENT
jgi:hypothetical protein